MPPTKTPTLTFHLLSPTAICPWKKTRGAAGYDLYPSEDGVIRRGCTKRVPTGVACNFNRPSYYGQIKSRSSLASNGITAQGGVVDNDYKGELFLIIQNSSMDHFYYHRSHAIAQLIIRNVPRVRVNISSYDGSTITPTPPNDKRDTQGDLVIDLERPKLKAKRRSEYTVIKQDTTQEHQTESCPHGSACIITGLIKSGAKCSIV